VPFLRSEIAANVVGCGSATTSSSSFSMPFTISVMRGTVLPPCPMMTTPFTASRWSTSSGLASVASNQRVQGMPGNSMFCLRVRAGRPAFAGTSSKRACR
jgi:hypothetical protein